MWSFHQHTCKKSQWHVFVSGSCQCLGLFYILVILNLFYILSCIYVYQYIFPLLCLSFFIIFIHTGLTVVKILLQIDFYIQDTPGNESGVILTPFNTSVIPCSQGLTSNSSACSCQDCRDTCPALLPPPPPPAPWTILHIDGYAFIMGSIYLLFLLVFGCYTICYNIMVQVGCVWFLADMERAGTTLQYLNSFSKTKQRKEKSVCICASVGYTVLCIQTTIFFFPKLNRTVNFGTLHCLPLALGVCRIMTEKNNEG